MKDMTELKTQMMGWDTKMQARFDPLRKDELAGTLTVQAETELAQLVTFLETEEKERLAPALYQLRYEQVALRTRLQERQSENEALAQLFGQQEQLVVDARQWLAQFERRHRLIRQSYSRLTGEVLLLVASSHGVAGSAT